MRSLNDCRIREHDVRIAQPCPIYQTADGDETLDVSEALLSNGSPIVVGYCKRKFTYLPVPESTLYIDPEDPLAMANAMADLGMFEGMHSNGNYYGDKFEAVDRINGIANLALENPDTL